MVQGLQQLDALLPNVLSLHRMKPSDWVGAGGGGGGAMGDLAEVISALRVSKLLQHSRQGGCHRPCWPDPKEARGLAPQFWAFECGVCRCRVVRQAG